MPLGVYKIGVPAVDADKYVPGLLWGSHLAISAHYKGGSPPTSKSVGAGSSPRSVSTLLELGVMLCLLLPTRLPRLLPPVLRRDAEILQLLQASYHGTLPGPPARVLGPNWTL